MHNPKISIVIPTFNRENIICDAINSVLGQNYNDFEIIVVDDGSTDGTHEVLNGFGNQIRVVRQVNSGVSAARNAGILAARGEWIAFLDSDDEWHPDTLEYLFGPFSNDSKVIARCGNIEFVGLDFQKDLFNLRGWNQKEPALLDRPLYRYFYLGLFPSGFTARRSVLLDAGLFDTSLELYEDTDLMARVATRGHWMITPKVIAKVYRKSKGDAVSLAHVTDPELTPRNLALVFKRLLLFEHLNLNKKEIYYIRRSLSGVLFDWAEARYAKTGCVCRLFLWWAILEGRSFVTFIRSATALLLGGVGFQWVNFLRRMKDSRVQSFRRSEKEVS